MTYETLTANIDLMRTGNEDALSQEKFSDEALLLLNKTAAKLEMKLDLEAALSVETDDTTTVDSAVDNNQIRISRALSYKQLFLYYFQNDAGEGTKNRMRMEYYRKMYDNEKSGFGSLTKAFPSGAVTYQSFKR